MQLTATTVMLSPVAAVLPATAQASSVASTTVRQTSDAASAAPRVDTAQVVPAPGTAKTAAPEHSSAESDPHRGADPRKVQATYRYLQQLVAQASLGSAAPAPTGVRPAIIEPAELIGVIAYFEATHALPVEEGADVDARA